MGEKINFDQEPKNIEDEKGIIIIREEPVDIKDGMTYITAEKDDKEVGFTSYYSGPGSTQEKREKAYDDLIKNLQKKFPGTKYKSLWTGEIEILKGEKE